MMNYEFCDAASEALEYYLRQVRIEIIARGTKYFCYDSKSGTWLFELPEGIVIYATPFFEMYSGIAIDIFDENGNDADEFTAPEYGLTFNIQKDAQSYIDIMRYSIDQIVTRMKGI